MTVGDNCMNGGRPDRHFKHVFDRIVNTTRCAQETDQVGIKQKDYKVSAGENFTATEAFSQNTQGGDYMRVGLDKAQHCSAS
jgi:hypothetical protein